MHYRFDAEDSAEKCRSGAYSAAATQIFEVVDREPMRAVELVVFNPLMK